MGILNNFMRDMKRACKVETKQDLKEFAKSINVSDKQLSRTERLVKRKIARYNKKHGLVKETEQ